MGVFGFAGLHSIIKNNTLISNNDLQIKITYDELVKLISIIIYNLYKNRIEKIKNKNRTYKLNRFNSLYTYSIIKSR